MEVLIDETATKGKAYVGDAMNPDAEMTFSKAGASLLIIDHTEVQASLKGQGAGRQLLNAIVEKARAHDIKILPLCPYAKTVFDKDPSLSDVLR